MAIRIWSSSGSIDMNSGSNYSGTGELLPNDDIVFNNTSVITASSTAPIFVNSITTSSNYTGSFIQGNYPMVISSGLLLEHTGPLALQNTVTITGSGNVKLNTALTTVTVDNAGLYVCGDSTITINENCIFDFMKLAYSGCSIIWNGSTGISAGAKNMVFNGGSVAVTTANFINIKPTNTSTPLIVADGSYINLQHVSSGLKIQPTNSENLVVLIPSLNIHGDGAVNFYSDVSSSGLTYIQQGDISIPLLNVGNFSSGYFIYDSNRKNINIFSSGFGIFNMVNNAGSGICSGVFNNSIITCELFRIQGSKVFNFDFRNTDIYCSGNFTITTPPNVECYDMSNIYITNTATITTKLEPMYNLILDAPGKTITWADGGVLNNLKITDGTNVKFKSLSGYILNNYNFSDWDGAIITATVGGSASSFTNPEGMKLFNASIKDISATNPVYTYSCINNGNCPGFIFPSNTIPQKKQNILYRFLRR